MVDYTTSSNRSGSSTVWIGIAVAVLVLVVLFALFTGDPTGTTTQPVVPEQSLSPAADPAAPAAPAIE